MTHVLNTTKTLSDIFKNVLSRNLYYKTEVQGFLDYQVGIFSCRSPLEIQNLLGPKFERNFQPTLLAAINEIKESHLINKSQLHKTLIHKYIGIDLDQDIQNARHTLQPNAYHAIPVEGSEDFQLHLYFLQPYKLFSITNQSRKYKGIDPATVNREWHWNKNLHCDSAPLFRTIIQAYILSEILEDHSATAENDWKDPTITKYFPSLLKLKNGLLNQIQGEMDTLFNSMKMLALEGEAEQEIEGDPKGLDPMLGDLLNELLPGFMDVSTFYPIGRLLLGQPRVEPHHAVASSELDPQQNTILYALKYSFWWLITHLNLSTSVFWIQSAIGICKSTVSAFKEYVYAAQPDFKALALKSLMIIPNVFILASTPLLILLPWIYGLTAIPFNLLRAVFMRFEKTRHYTAFKILDGIEFIKDVALFGMVAVPALNLIMASINAFMPGILLSIGAVISTTALIMIWAILNKDRTYHNNNDIEGIMQLGASHYFRFIGLSVFLGIGAFLGSALVTRQVAPYISQRVIDSFHWGMTPVYWVGQKLSALLNRVVKDTITLDATNIIPQELAVEEIVIPQAEFMIPESYQNEIFALSMALGKLNSAFNFSPQRKALARAVIEKLEAPKSQEALKAALEEGRSLTANNFTADESTTIRNLIEELKNAKVNDPQFQKEGMGIAVNGKGGAYQPSWNMIKILREQNKMDKLSAAMQEKIGRIEGLRGK